MEAIRVGDQFCMGVGENPSPRQKCIQIGIYKIPVFLRNDGTFRELGIALSSHGLYFLSPKNHKRRFLLELEGSLSSYNPPPLPRGPGDRKIVRNIDEKKDSKETRRQLASRAASTGNICALTTSGIHIYCLIQNIGHCLGSNGQELLPYFDKECNPYKPRPPYLSNTNLAQVMERKNVICNPPKFDKGPSCVHVHLGGQRIYRIPLGKDGTIKGSKYRILASLNEKHEKDMAPYWLKVVYQGAGPSETIHRCLISDSGFLECFMGKVEVNFETSYCLGKNIPWRSVSKPIVFWNMETLNYERQCIEVNKQPLRPKDPDSCDFEGDQNKNKGIAKCANGAVIDCMAPMDGEPVKRPYVELMEDSKQALRDRGVSYEWKIHVEDRGNGKWVVNDKHFKQFNPYRNIGYSAGRFGATSTTKIFAFQQKGKEPRDKEGRKLEGQKFLNTQCYFRKDKWAYEGAKTDKHYQGISKAIVCEEEGSAGSFEGCLMVDWLLRSSSCCFMIDFVPKAKLELNPDISWKGYNPFYPLQDRKNRDIPGADDDKAYKSFSTRIREAEGLTGKRDSWDIAQWYQPRNCLRWKLVPLPSPP